MAANQYVKSLLTQLAADPQMTKGDRAAVSRTIRLLDGWYDWRDVTELAQCRTIMDGLRFIAARDGGFIQVSSAAREIIRAGLSQAQMMSCYSNCWHMMDISDEWEWVQPGLYRWLAAPPSIVREVIG